jgi:hypothetical protein
MLTLYTLLPNILEHQSTKKCNALQLLSDHAASFPCTSAATTSCVYYKLDLHLPFVLSRMISANREKHVKLCVQSLKEKVLTRVLHSRCDDPGRFQSPSHPALLNRARPHPRANGACPDIPDVTPHLHALRRCAGPPVLVSPPTPSFTLPRR